VSLRFTALRTACSTSIRRSGEASSSQAPAVRINESGGTLPKSEVVRHAAPHHRGLIVLQQLQEREHAIGMLIEPHHPLRPREAKARALGHGPTDVRVLVRGPRVEERHRS
jgi:hypothetical protein